MDKKFIVLCPGWVKTGGPEALHQLAYHLNTTPGASCSVMYYGKRAANVVHEYQALYPVPETTRMNDTGAHIIFPEGLDPQTIPCPSGGSRWVWWLSANRYYPIHQYENCGHLFQSEYARAKLGSLGATGLMLTDYIRELFTSDVPTAESRQPWVAYNAAKSSVAALILARSQEFALLPIQNMDANQVRHVLSRCSLYVDFGAHPGRDRLPREAVMNECMIVTGIDGAAANNIDVPISDNYKIPVAQLPEALPMLLSLIRNYDTKIVDFSEYRHAVKQQKTIFQNEIAALIAAVETPRHYQQKSFIPQALDHFLLQQELQHRDREYLHAHLAATLVDDQIKGIKKMTSVDLRRFSSTH